jgi:hypothetical protein
MNYAARHHLASAMVEKWQIERYQSIAVMQGSSTPVKRGTESEILAVLLSAYTFTSST